MNKKLMLCSVVCSFVAFQSQAADDVYVDLSVLDTIPQDSVGFVDSSPVFPEYKKPVVLPRKKTVLVRPKTQQTKKNPVVVQPIKPQHVEQIATGTLQEKPEQDVVSVLPEKIESSSEKLPEVLPQENIAEDKVVMSDVQEKRDIADVTNEEVVAINESVKEVTKTAKENANPASILPQPVMTSEDISQTGDAKVLSAKSSDVIENSQGAALPREVYSISFAPDSSELSEENIRYLDEVIGSFDKEQKKKISIKAYNYDDGVNSFRKKRVSLLRATQVRSYLLNRGFKDFGIKIINTTVDNEDKNTVEIEEIN
ncbi:MAG: OmpA family protein [Alphaproteobacteria bacterium]|nr:OmpA family protein [Alphaproteobacteria bacterium]